MEEVKWTFEKVRPGTTERDSVSEEFFANGTRLSAIIRESIQNSLDAAMPAADGTKQTVKVRIYFSGTEGALSADDYRPYRETANERYFSPGNGLRKPVPADDQDCQFITIEDFHTTGLSGKTLCKPSVPEDEEHRREWNYYNYFFRENGTSKGQKDTRGSWGAGKCVFQRASSLKTSFALSIRDGWTPREFLVGKATLKIHQDSEHRTWAPDGWFGVYNPVENDDDTRNPKQPVVDSEIIQRFKHDFHLSRVDEPGTSIVIPHVRLESDEEGQLAEFSRTNLVRAVLSNFLVAILDGDLEVEIQVGPDGTPVVVNRETEKSLRRELPDPSNRAVVVSRIHADLIATALSQAFPETGVFNATSPGSKPDWCPEMFSLDQLRAMKKRLRAKQPIVVKVPMPVLHRKDENSVETLNGSFLVAIERADLPHAAPPVFFRLGLLVDAVKAPATNYYAAAVVIGAGSVADMLVSAEPPSHNEWRKDADRLTVAYRFHAKHLAFVQNAAREILNAIDSSDKELSFEPLADVFGIPKEEEKKPEDEENKKKPNPGEDEGDEGGKPDKPPRPKAAFVEFNEIQGTRKGFKVSSGPGLAEAKEFPFVLPLEIGYDTFKGLDWSQFDFRLEDETKISVETTGPVEIAKREGNNLELRVLSNEPAFTVSVTGFDPNRDLSVNPGRYQYPSTQTEES